MTKSSKNAFYTNIMFIYTSERINKESREINLFFWVDLIENSNVSYICSKRVTI